MTEDQKLDSGQKNMLRLIRKGAATDGWAPVSNVIAPLFAGPKPPWRGIPPELCEFELVDESGAGRARLTQAGNNILDAMEWL
jgi:hypothetical protein